MERLDGFLAFVLTLASLATVVTILVEAGQRILFARSRGLKKMLEGYLDDVLLPKLNLDNKMAEELKKKGSEARRAVINTLLKSPIYDKIVTSWFWKFLAPLTKPTSLNAQEFGKRLLNVPDLDAKLSAAGQAGKDALVKELAAKYEEYGAAISDYFKRRAQVTSIIVGLLLAICANVHGLRIYETFLSDPALRERMILRMDVIEKQVNTVAQKPSIAKTASAENKDVNEIKVEFDRARSDVTNLVGLGIPIGWQFYPNCLQAVKNYDPQCKTFQEKKASVCLDGSKKDSCTTLLGSIWRTRQLDRRQAFKWLFTVLMTGVLIGLGGPFWFDVAKRLGQIRKDITGQSSQSQTDKKPAAAEASK